jgi:glutamate synthase (ferredoxin)
LSSILYSLKKQRSSNHNTTTQDHALEHLDFDIIKAAIPSIYRKEKNKTFDIKNTDRSGAILSNEISKYMVHKVYLRIPY